jgi:phosphopantetheine adenylyltransferase
MKIDIDKMVRETGIPQDKILLAIGIGANEDLEIERKIDRANDQESLVETFFMIPHGKTHLESKLIRKLLCLFLNGD